MVGWAVSPNGPKLQTHFMDLSVDLSLYYSSRYSYCKSREDGLWWLSLKKGSVSIVVLGRPLTRCYSFMKKAWNSNEHSSGVHRYLNIWTWKVDVIKYKMETSELACWSFYINFKSENLVYFLLSSNMLQICQLRLAILTAVQSLRN